MDAKQFLKDTAGHEMTVLMDNGIYRHLHFAGPKPNSWNQWFDLITWPGSLTIKGDMGTWAFSRVEDMFTFFRSTGELEINASYWAEKIDSESRFGGPHKKFDLETFKANVLSSLDGYEVDESEKPGILQELEFDVFCEEDESSARRKLAEFERNDFKFSDSWEIDGDKYTLHYLWCLYAIVWGIQQYDATKAHPAPQEAVVANA